jgi:nucleotide-binding universal stress UspA family protein
MTRITCVFRRTAEGRLALAFAADLLRLLGSAAGETLNIYVEPGEADAARISSQATPTSQILAEQNSRILEEVAGLTGLPAGAIDISESAADCILVDHILAFERADLDVLYPSREKTILGRGRGPLLVPFGDSHTALPAANIAIMLGKLLALPVVFYHTTWADETVTSQVPADHMCEGAKEVAVLLRQNATNAGIEFSFVIETADDVAEGILQCALRQSARLIVMPRSAKTTIGCYVNQALAKTPVPLLAVPSKPGRQQ